MSTLRNSKISKKKVPKTVKLVILLDFDMQITLSDLNWLFDYEKNMIWTIIILVIIYNFFMYIYLNNLGILIHDILLNLIFSLCKENYIK